MARNNMPAEEETFSSFPFNLRRLEEMMEARIIQESQEQCRLRPRASTVTEQTAIESGCRRGSWQRLAPADIQASLLC